MRRFAKWMGGVAAVVVVAGCGGDGGNGGISPTGPLFVGNTATVTVSCPTQMEVGHSSTCNAYGYDSNGTYTNSNESSWSSSNTSVATVSSSGAISAVGTGSATISAVIDGVTGSTSVSVVASTLSVSLDGPTSVKPNTECMWWASASGGLSPYTYSWSGGYAGWSGGDYYYATSPGSGTFTIYLTVTDAGGAQKSTSVPVSVSSNAMICPI